MQFVNGTGGDQIAQEEYHFPALIFNTGMIICQTQNQCSLFESPKNAQVVRVPRPNQMDVGDSLNDGGWM